MKKFLIAGLALTAALSFTGCDLIIDILETAANGTSSQDITQTATESKTWNYSATNNIFEIGPKVASVTIENYSAAKDKTIYLVHANKSNTEIPAGNLRTVQATSSVAATPVRAAATDDALEIPEFEYKYRHFVPPTDVSSIEKVTSAARAVYSTTLTAATQISRTVDTTKKYIYVDSNKAMDQYTPKAATLRAVGTYCNVWIVDEYYTSGDADENKANTAIAQKFATKFDEIYPYITKVFGSESDQLVTTSGTQTLINMETYSDTGNIINIVLYDIGVDYTKNQNGGVLGYFYAKDYYYTGGQTYSGSNAILNYSNQGKYFYVDSGFAVSAFKTVLSTLAHEFQHMVNFGQKNIKYKTAPDTWYNEMLSMLCEDMMQEKLGIDDADSPKGRLQSFNAYYYASGINEWLDDNAVLSYSVAYAFGGWLCRQYGGAALVKAIMANAYVDDESIVEAVNSKNGTSYTWDDLFEQFLLCITGSSKYTMNQDAAQTLEHSGYTYPMTAIDLWASAWGLTSLKEDYSEYIYKNYDFLGPILFSSGAGTTLRPAYGFLLHGLDVVSSGTTKTLTFSSTGSENLTMYLIIQ